MNLCALKTHEKVELTARGIWKEFGGQVVLREASISLKPGLVTGLLGGNAAGKSTLIRILSGDLKPSRGTITISGATYNRLNCRQAITLGIRTIYQDLALCLGLDVTENIFLGCEFLHSSAAGRLFRIVDRSQMDQEARVRLGYLGIRDMNLTQPVRELSGGRKQTTALARILTPDLKILLLDEPTSALSETMKPNFHAVIKTLCESGRSILYISHDIRELRAVSHEILVLEHGVLTPRAR